MEPQGNAFDISVASPLLGLAVEEEEQVGGSEQLA